jgi:hypothetical protein
MRTIFKCEFGSAIYGTSTPESDKDYKSIFLPDPQSIILQQVPRNITKNTKTDITAKNTSNDIDDEAFSLQEYLRLLCQGQTPMLDMLFCPEDKVMIRTEEWYRIKSYRHTFLHKGTSAFVGYVRQQAAKYGVKGYRVDAMKTALNVLKGLPLQNKPLSEYMTLLNALVDEAQSFRSTEENKGPFIQWTELPEKKNGPLKPHLEVCNRKFPLSVKVSYAVDCLEKIYEGYGHRARQAALNVGVDWKALYHAVRVARQSEELLLTHNITFPRPEAPLLLQIRKGELPYEQVAEIIEDGLKRVEAARQISTLPEQASAFTMDRLVYELYSKELKNWFDTGR